MGRAHRTGRELAAATLSAVYLGAILLQMLIGILSDLWSRTAALRLCGVVGLIGALALASVMPSTPVLFCLLFVWGGIASGIYPVALSMAVDPASRAPTWSQSTRRSSWPMASAPWPAPRSAASRLT